MRKSPLTILGLLFLLAVGAIFCLIVRPGPNKKESSTPIASDNQPPRLKRDTRDPAVYRAQMKDFMEKMDESNIRSAALFTPEVQAAVSRGAKHNLKVTYAPLFLKWGLDEQTADKVLSLIFERDEVIRKASYQQYSEGRSGLRDFQWTEATEKSTARLQLELVLGKERTDELCRVEAERDLDVMANATGVPKETLRQRMSSSSRSIPKASSPPVFKRD